MAELAKRTAKEVTEEDCLGMAAQLAYHLALALSPALIVLVTLLSYLPFSVLDSLINAINRIAPAEIVTLVRDQIVWTLQRNLRCARSRCNSDVVDISHGLGDPLGGR
jgi:uncharacterized BrkB/YihY/UPF0761 family membrane protein